MTVQPGRWSLLELPDNDASGGDNDADDDDDDTTTQVSLSLHAPAPHNTKNLIALSPPPQLDRGADLKFFDLRLSHLPSP